MSNANHIQHTGAASSNPFLAIAAAYGDYTKKSFEDTKLFVEKLCGAKSLENAIEVQTEFRAGSGCLNSNPASISGASAGVRPPRGAEEDRSRLDPGCGRQD